jgi:nitrite reductase/ring-hydroxylating ferredoxin subunit/uncharacterized membrane protein
MSTEPPIDLVERQNWLEPIETQGQKAVSSAFSSLPDGGRPLKNFLHGTWLGHPLHPVLTDVPLGAWTATLVLDLMDASGRKDCRPGADVTLAVGLAGAACAAFAGITDWHATDGPARRVGVVHGMLNLVGACLYTASLIARKQRNRTAGRALAYAGFATAAVSAYLGGNLVYGKNIGVNHAPEDPQLADWTNVMNAADLHDGTPHRADLNGLKLLLVRDGGELRCLAEVCSHLGGPLAEGTIADGAVTCPWHSSRFSLSDGSVLDGPATHPQPCLDARIAGDRIQVRSRQKSEPRA